MTRQDILTEVAGLKDIRVRFILKSRYQVRRYKPECVQPEAWIFAPRCPSGYLVTEEDYNNQEYRKNFFDMIRGENKPE